MKVEYTAYVFPADAGNWAHSTRKYQGGSEVQVALATAIARSEVKASAGDTVVVLEGGSAWQYKIEEPALPPSPPPLAVIREDTGREVPIVG